MVTDFCTLFQIPYVLMLFGAGLPILFLEVCLGQYAGVGPIQIFGRMAPILKGLGYVSTRCCCIDYIARDVRENDDLFW